MDTSNFERQIHPKSNILVMETILLGVILQSFLMHFENEKISIPYYG